MLSGCRQIRHCVCGLNISSGSIGCNSCLLQCYVDCFQRDMLYL